MDVMGVNAAELRARAVGDTVPEVHGQPQLPPVVHDAEDWGGRQNQVASSNTYTWY